MFPLAQEALSSEKGIRAFIERFQNDEDMTAMTERAILYFLAFWDPVDTTTPPFALYEEISVNQMRLSTKLTTFSFVSCDVTDHVRYQVYSY